MPFRKGFPFFVELVRRFVGAFLSERGFVEVRSSTTRVTYQRSDSLLSVAYYLEDMPEPWVAVDLGLVREDGTHQLVGLWRALADDDPARGYTSWTFEDEESLARVLHGIVDMLARRALDLCGSPDRLRELLALQEDEGESRYLEVQHEAELARARRAFDEGRFRDALDGFAIVGTDQLSAADRRRAHQARGRLTKGQADAG